MFILILFIVCFNLQTLHTIIPQQTNHHITYAPNTQGINFWNQIRKGTNIFNRYIAREDIKAAKNFGIDFIRLATDKFPSNEKDFLIGDADNYVQLVKEDVATLKKILDMCYQEQIPVVVTMLSLPGSRWKQNNKNVDDLRIWNDFNFQKQAAQFWHDLVKELYMHPAIIGYNILNEPHPEKMYNQPSDTTNQTEIQNKLFDCYSLIIKAIRSVDKHMPIILDSSAYADPQTLIKFKVHDDYALLYSFHMYEPFEYTNKPCNMGNFHYPGPINGTYWDKKELNKYLESVRIFQQKNSIQNNRILVGEFGGHRTSSGLSNYFNDLKEIFTENSWHFAFYAFREDTWDGMDYELGDQPLPSTYWQSLKKEEIIQALRNHNNPQFKILVTNNTMTQPSML